MDTIGKISVALWAFLALTFVQIVTNGEEIPCGDLKLEPLGCFVDNTNNRAMEKEILNERDWHSVNNVHKLTFQWKSYGQFLIPFICRCAEEARNKGYSVFGGQFYGECWSSDKAPEEYNKHGSSSECIDKIFNPTPPPANDSCIAGMGKASTNFVYRIADSTCKTAEYKPLGCHMDNVTNRALPNYILNDRDPTHESYSGKMINWKEWDTYLPDFICRCAEKAKAKGDDLFAAQFYGECWSGKKGRDNHAQFGTSSQCVGLGMKKCHCNDYRCIGVASTNYVYELVGKSKDVVANNTSYKVEIV